VVPFAAGTTTSPSMIADPALMFQASAAIFPEMDLNAIAVELDLMDPTFARRYLVNRRGQSGFDEAGIVSFDARLWPGIAHENS
jgi:hypothetical protein